MKRSLLLLPLLLAAGLAPAQVRIGPKAGLNLATMSIAASGATASPDNRVSLHAGAVADMPLSRLCSYQTGLLYSSLGYAVERNGASVRMRTHYIQIPLLFQLCLPASAKVTLLTQAGPYLGFCLGGKLMVKQNGTERSQDLAVGDNGPTGINLLDAGLYGAMGVEVRNVQLTLGYGFGLANAAPLSDQNGVRSYNRNLMISLAYLLPARKAQDQVAP